MERQANRQRAGGWRLLDSNRFFLVAAVVILGLLLSFYAVLLVNMNAIDTKTEDLKEHPYTVTVAAGRAETLLMQVRTLDDRLAFTRTLETITSVKTEFATIDVELQASLDTILERCRSNQDRALNLYEQYKDFRVQQDMLIQLSEMSDDDSEIAAFLSEHIDPLIDRMLADNNQIIQGASESFDQLYTKVAITRADAIATSTVLMAAVLVALVLVVLLIRRKNQQQQRLQESLRCAVQEAQHANAAKSRFLSNVSHDIRTPLTAIIGLTDLAVERTDDPHRVAESLEKIKLSSHHLLNLVNDVLDMSKIESGQIDIARAPFDMRALVDTLVSIMRPQADAKHLTLDVDSAGMRDGSVLGDEMRVSQVLINLLGNAVKYTEAEGHVRFSIRDLNEAERAEAQAKGLGVPVGFEGCPDTLRVVRFVVEDNGVGMSEEFIERVFDPFEREDGPTRFTVQGTGLGMSIAKNLVDIMGGIITVKSARGSGSRFTLDLPFEPCSEHDMVACAAIDAASGATVRVECDALRTWNHVRVLLAEDNDIVGEIAEQLIVDLGASVDRAWDGAEALSLLEHAPDTYYDLVFMDVQMPHMDGLEAARTITERFVRDGRTRPPIIAMTANAYVEDRQKALESGMDGYAVKPIGKSELCRLFETYAKPRGAE